MGRRRSSGARTLKGPSGRVASSWRTKRLARPRGLRCNCPKMLCNSCTESQDGHAVGRITYLCVSPEGRLAQLPDKLGRMAIALRFVGWLLIFALLASTVFSQGMKILGRWEDLAALADNTGPFSEFESRVALLRGDLPSRGRIHLVTEPPSGDWAFWVYLFAQYTLAPLVLDHELLPGRSVVVSVTGPQLDALVLRHNWRVLRRVAPNIALVDWSDAEKAQEPSAESESTPR